MWEKRRKHITVTEDTFKYLKRKQDEYDTNFSDAIAKIITENRDCKEKIKKKVLDDVVEHVIELYMNGQYYSKN